MNKELKTLLVLAGLIVGVISFYYQAVTFVFVHLNRSSNDPEDYSFDFTAQLATLTILFVFLVLCFRWLANQKQKG
jgi:uncharacterized BrkB/YihY/UPF0761 family membrane protein